MVFNCIVFELLLLNVTFFSQVSNRGFVICVVKRSNAIVFEPSFNSFQASILSVYDSMIAAVSALPRLENLLFIDWPETECLSVSACQFLLLKIEWHT